MYKRLLTSVVLAVVVSLALVSTASAASQEYGSAKKWPWSGYWWPMLQNGYNLYTNGGPMQKFDQWTAATTGRQGGAQAWEYQNRSTTNEANSWWGFCHAWASASILTPEPQPVVRNGVSFSTNDVKGLVTSLYYEPTFTWLSGTRVDNPNDHASAAYQDIAPAWMDYLLRYYVRYYKYPFIMDINADSQVWNYPVFAYQRTSEQYAGGVEGVKTTVWFTSPDWNTTGTKYFAKTYTYYLKPGTLGSWYGASVNDHPDFAWVPTGKRAGSGTNPYVTEASVEAITGQND